jgi:hypothetical protein
MAIAALMAGVQKQQLRAGVSYSEERRPQMLQPVEEEAAQNGRHTAPVPCYGALCPDYRIGWCPVSDFGVLPTATRFGGHLSSLPSN